MASYPIYVISKGRWEAALTARFLLKDKVPFYLVVEPQEEKKYREFKKHLLILPFKNLGLGSIPARNWCWEDARARGAERHWILDDNISFMATLKKGKRVRCDSTEAFEKVERFVDKYENIAVAGINYWMFGFSVKTPFFLNHHAYSCLLIRNDLPFRWRGRYNEDTDLCLQALSTNYWCTVNVNAFLIYKMPTMVCKGGNTDELYKGRGRLVMSRSLEHAWMHKPGLVKTTFKWGRAQHHVNWKRFRNPLILKPSRKTG